MQRAVCSVRLAGSFFGHTRTAAGSSAKQSAVHRAASSVHVARHASKAIDVSSWPATKRGFATRACLGQTLGPVRWTVWLVSRQRSWCVRRKVGPTARCTQRAALLFDKSSHGFHLFCPRCRFNRFGRLGQRGPNVCPRRARVAKPLGVAGQDETPIASMLDA